MIRVDRGPEPARLADRRVAQLATVGPTKPTRTAAHRAAYNSVKDDLAAAQHRKCCYCERVVTRAYNDVEHYRPFSGYWWLAWTWDNLLFACATCNRSGKNDAFPLESALSKLAYGQQPPGDERPLLIDPGSEDPAAHIDFEQTNGRWWPVGRTIRGRATLEALALDDDYRDDIERHVESVMERIRGWETGRPARPDHADASLTSFIASLVDDARAFTRLTQAVVRAWLDDPGRR